MKTRTYGILAGILCVLAGLGFIAERLYATETSPLPSWLPHSINDITSISVQGWGPGASGNYVVYPPAGQSSMLINKLVDELPRDRTIQSHVTAIATSGADWLEIRLQNGTSIEFGDFPNEPRPLQYHVTLTSGSGGQEKSAMISDISGVITSAIRAINTNGSTVRAATTNINIPSVTSIKKATIGGTLPGRTVAGLTRKQETSILGMLKNAQDTGYHSPDMGGYPSAVSIQLTSGRSIFIVLASNMKRHGNSETGEAVENFVDWYDSADTSNRPQRLYSPELYAFLSNWTKIAPKSQRTGK